MNEVCVCSGTAIFAASLKENNVQKLNKEALAICGFVFRRSCFGIYSVSVATSKAENSVTQQPPVIVQDTETQKYTPYSMKQCPS